MNLLEMKTNEKAVIDAINVNGPLKDRLCGLGLHAQCEICVKHYSLFKSTVQICVNSSYICLRRSEAAQIDVHRVA